MVTWEPYTDGGTSPPDIEVRIARGDVDAYVSAWASDLRTFLAGPDHVYGTGDDRRAYLRLAHEMNGNWYPWAAARGRDTPADYVAMWKWVHNLFKAEGIDAKRLQWVWAPNLSDVGGFRAEKFFPGKAYVDWMGIDG